jgi:hypothetical protein
MTTDFQTAFDPDALCALAWGRSFERGTAYAANGRVQRLKVTDHEASATVRGSRAFRVRLWIEDGEPAFSCTCPVGDDGLFCKHCVAVGLAAAETEAWASLSAGRCRPPARPDVRAHLQSLDKTRLVDLLLEQADSDELLRGRLELEAARAHGGHGGIDAYRHAIREVLHPGGFIDYHSMYDYSRGVRDLIDSLAVLLSDGLSAEVVDHEPTSRAPSPSAE